MAFKMAQAAASSCEICIGGPGEHYCLQCNQLFCESCKLSHLRANICKNHTFLSGPKKSDALFCAEHEERCLSYCHDCDTPVCIVCSREKHRYHLMKGLAESIQEIKSELFEKIESREATANFNLGKIEKDTKAYREKVLAVIKTITEEGKYRKQLIDKKVEALIKLVQDKEQRETQNMTAYSEVYKGVAENCKTWQNNIRKMETTANILLLNKLKQLKNDVDQKVVKQIPDAPDVSYRNKKTSDTEIDNLFGELQFLNSKVVPRQTDKEQRAKLKAKKERYRYVCTVCGKEEVSIKEPVILYGECSNMKCDYSSIIGNITELDETVNKVRGLVLSNQLLCWCSKVGECYLLFWSYFTTIKRMLCFRSKQKQVNKQIEKRIKRDKDDAEKEVRVLLLGCGDCDHDCSCDYDADINKQNSFSGTHQSGKGTLLRMLRVVHGDNYSDDEKRRFIVHIYNQVVNAIQELVVEMDLQHCHYKSPTNEMLENARMIKQNNYTSNKTVNWDDMDTIKSLWADPGMKKCYKECKGCQLTDSQRYFMDHIDRITESHYVPTLHDILHCTINSCGITEHLYNIDGHLFRFIDIRGARTERRKWIHYLDNISVLMFIVALSDYNKIESYSDNENRLDIAKSLFKTIIDYPWFQNCGIIMFLNKRDILEEQIMQTDLVDYFSEFKGPKKNAHEAIEFIIKMFVELNTDHDRIIYPYSVCLLDAENVKTVLASAIKDMVMHQNLMKNTITTCCCF